MSRRELWASMSVADHTRPYPFLAEVLLFDRVVVPAPPEGDDEEHQRWVDERWQPVRQRRLLGILGQRGGDGDLAVTIPWTEAKRRRFAALHAGDEAPPAARAATRRRMAEHIQIDATGLKPDAQMATRLLLTREYDEGEERYQQTLPRAWVEAVVPAYSTFERAQSETGVAAAEGDGPTPSAQVIGWEMFLPATDGMSEEQALETAAQLARTDDYRAQREEFRRWWRDERDAGRPADSALQELRGKADRLNAVVAGNFRRSVVRRSFALLTAGAGVGAALATGTWAQSAASTSAMLGLVTLGADWLLGDQQPDAGLRPAAMFTSARRQLGWNRGARGSTSR